MRQDTTINTAVTVPARLEDFGPPRGTPSDPSLPRYAPLETLGEGGMGEVHLCADRRIGRQVAMKVMRPSHAKQRDMRVRFLREALVQGQLEHPTIVPVYDVATSEDGAPYFTMKRVHGVTLEEVLDRLRAGDEAAERQHSRHKLLTAFASACLAVHFAHRRGVLHRDLKPTNVMLGDFGEVYVLDWGLAKLAGDAQDAVAATDESAASGRTELGAIMGTPGYISPEQLQHESIDERADVYALGAILFELLTLKPLHEADNPAKLCASALRGGDARASVRVPERDVPPELETICVKATALAPHDRFATVGELYDALERFLEGDRDLERRRQMAAELLLRTRAGLKKAPLDSTRGATSRSEAIRDLGRALALDPANTEAADVLVALLTEPPTEMPREALEEMYAEERHMQHLRTRVGGIAFLCTITLMPVWLWVGVKSWTDFVLVSAAFFVAGGAFLHVSRHPSHDGMSPLYPMVLSAFAVGTMSTIVGPLLVLPGLAATLACGLSLATPRRHRFYPAALCVLAMVVPFALELVGVLPPSYSFENGAMCALPRMILLRKVPTYSLFVLINAITIGMGAFFGMSVRSALTDAHRRMTLRAWQLRQLIPKEAGSALATRAPSPGIR